MLVNFCFQNKRPEKVQLDDEPQINIETFIQSPESIQGSLRKLSLKLDLKKKNENKFCLRFRYIVSNDNTPFELEFSASNAYLLLFS